MQDAVKQSISRLPLALRKNESYVKLPAGGRNGKTTHYLNYNKRIRQAFFSAVISLLSDMLLWNGYAKMRTEHRPSYSRTLYAISLRRPRFANEMRSVYLPSISRQRETYP